MKLTRRDAVLALAASGITVGAVQTRTESGDGQNDPPDSRQLVEKDLRLLRATAEVVYPSSVETTTEFVETYVVGRTNHRSEYARHVREGVRRINDYSKREFGKDFDALSVDKRDQLLRRMGLGRVTPSPDGSQTERIRYYVVNELLYSLYATPVGGALLGNDNPPGYAGGVDTYRRVPDDR